MINNKIDQIHTLNMLLDQLNYFDIHQDTGIQSKQQQGNTYMPNKQFQCLLIFLCHKLFQLNIHMNQLLKFLKRQCQGNSSLPNM